MVDADLFSVSAVLAGCMLDKDAFEARLDASWQSFRQQLRDVYPIMPATLPSTSAATFQVSSALQMISGLDSEAHAATDGMAVGEADEVPEAEVPPEKPREKMSRPSWI